MERNERGQWKKGVSGNRAGKPKGTKNKHSRRQSTLAHMDQAPRPVTNYKTAFLRSGERCDHCGFALIPPGGRNMENPPILCADVLIHRHCERNYCWALWDEASKPKEQHRMMENFWANR